MAEQTECFARGIKSVGEIFVMNLPSYRIVRNIVYNFQYSIIYTKKNPLFTMKRIKIFLCYTSAFFQKKKKRERKGKRKKERKKFMERTTQAGEKIWDKKYIL